MWLVIGTRPEAIKLAPVIHALLKRGRSVRLVLTGQHPGLDPTHFGIGEIETIRLRCPGAADPYDHARLVEFALRPHLRKLPAILVVQGDTSSAYGAAKAAFVAGVPVAHVEAGLRTHDPHQPWPEEEFRTAIDARSRLLLAPTETSAANLVREGLEGELHITGNTGIDALLALLDTLPPRSVRDAARPRVLVTCHRRESWGSPLIGIGHALSEIASCCDVDIDLVLHPNPKVANALRRSLGPRSKIVLHQPLSHSELILAMRGSSLILSDSGGIQEEAPALGVPLMVLREKTERPEAIASGNAILVGNHPQRIISEASRLLRNGEALEAMAQPAFPFGDGRAAPRIAAIIDDWLARPRHR